MSDSDSDEIIIKRRKKCKTASVDVDLLFAQIQEQKQMHSELQKMREKQKAFRPLNDLKNIKSVDAKENTGKAADEPPNEPSASILQLFPYWDQSLPSVDDVASWTILNERSAEIRQSKPSSEPKDWANMYRVAAFHPLTYVVEEACAILKAAIRGGKSVTHQASWSQGLVNRSKVPAEKMSGRKPKKNTKPMKPTFIPSLDDFISTLIEYGFETKDYSTRGKSESGRRGVKVFPWRNFGAIIDVMEEAMIHRGDDLSPALLEPVVKILTTVYARLVLKNVSDATSEDCKDSMACAKKVGNCLRRAILWGLVIPKEDTDIEKILVDIALGFKSPLLCAEYVQEVLPVVPAEHPLHKDAICLRGRVAGKIMNHFVGTSETVRDANIITSVHKILSTLVTRNGKSTRLDGDTFELTAALAKLAHVACGQAGSRTKNERFEFKAICKLFCEKIPESLPGRHAGHQKKSAQISAYTVRQWYLDPYRALQKRFDVAKYKEKNRKRKC